MGNLIGGIVMPYLPELAGKETRAENALLERVSAAMEKSADALKKRGPQTVVMLSPDGAVIEDAVSLYMQPRLKGSLADAHLPEIILGFETDSFLMKMILKQGERLGIPLELLTDDILEARRLNAKLSDASLIPLYYLHKSGFKGQIVNFAYAELANEEMYTLGKAVRLAIEKSSKPTAVVVAAECPFTADGGANYNRQVLDALLALDVKALLHVDRSSLDAAGAKHLRAFFFFLGVLSGGEFADTSLYEEQIARRTLLVANFLS